MSLAVTIRPEAPGDYAAVRHVNEAAFSRPDEADLVERLRERADPYLGLVAVREGEVVGHVAFSPVTLAPPRPAFRARGLAPMAVLPAHQRQGVGSLLVWEGLAACRRGGCAAVFVLGHPDYYPRFGFSPARGYGIGSEYDVPDEAFMALALRPGALDEVRGTVRYAPAFVA